MRQENLDENDFSEILEAVKTLAEAEHTMYGATQSGYTILHITEAKNILMRILKRHEPQQESNQEVRKSSK